MGAYGQEGVERAMALLRDELVMDMRLLGVASLDELDGGCGCAGPAGPAGPAGNGGSGTGFLDFRDVRFAKL